MDWHWIEMDDGGALELDEPRGLEIELHVWTDGPPGAETLAAWVVSQTGDLAWVPPVGVA